MDRIEVSTVVYLPPEEVYAFLLDFPRYADYSEYLRRVRQRGDGSPGTRYALEFAWWKLSYTARSVVTDVDPPTRIDWRLTKDIDASGHWAVEELAELPADAPADAATACRVRFVAGFDPESARSGVLDLPRFVSFDWVLDRLKPTIREEAERIVARIVADIEERDRPVEVTVHQSPETV